MIKILEKTFKVILNMLIILVIIALIILMYGRIQMKVTGNDYPNYFGYTFFKVTSGSMKEELQVGDVVVIKLHSNFKENDIITFTADNNFITHRIIKIDNNMITTKGDANNSKDKVITKDKVLGKVVYKIEEMAILREILTTPEILLFIFLTVLFFNLAFSYKNKYQKID